MTMEKEMTALALPGREEFIAKIKAINEFQQIVHQHLIEGADWGVIPGTQKPTLLKPGAEKIAKLLGLADLYEIEDRQEDWQKPFFRYLIRCKLVHVGSQAVISEGLGECNSMESKYRYRWVSERDLPQGTDKTKLIVQERHAKTGGGKWKVYRLDNEDIYSQVNTILKMAKKRALVDAALSAGRLSNVFTQDIEDTGTVEEPDTIPKPMSASVTQKGAVEKEKVGITTEETDKPSLAELDFDFEWLKETLGKVKWKDSTVKSYLQNRYPPLDTEGTVTEVVARLSRENRELFFKEIANKVQMI